MRIVGIIKLYTVPLSFGQVLKPFFSKPILIYYFLLEFMEVKAVVYGFD